MDDSAAALPGSLSWCFPTGTLAHSEMTQRIKEFPWHETPLGPIVSWPISLQVALSICLSSRFPVFMWFGPELRVIYNDAYAPQFGKKHPWALGQPGKQVWSEIYDEIGPALERVLATGEASWCEDKMLFINRDGYAEETYWTYSYSPIRSQDNSVVGVFTAIEESTSRLLHERRLRTLQELSARTAVATVTTEAARAALEVFSQNPLDLPFACLYLLDDNSDGSQQHMALCNVVGALADQSALPTRINVTTGESHEHPTAQQIASQVRQMTSSTTLTSCELEVPSDMTLQLSPRIERPRKAILLPLRSAAITTTENGSSALGILLLGLNSRKKLDAAYRTFLTLLASALTAALVTTRDFEREKKRAEMLAELDRAKTTFFHNISHEFRTPLTLMLGPLEEVLQTELSNQQRDTLDVVLRNGNRLLKLVNVLLDFSRIEAGRMKASFCPVQLSTLTLELVSLFRSACERVELSLQVDCPALREPVYVDVDMWEKIVTNLLSNAYKYTLHGHITVQLTEVERNAVLIVRDTGCGIPEKELPHIFERFYRVSSTVGRTNEGTGIGLALIYELIKMHGGNIQVESTPNVGSTFRVYIPLGRAHLPSNQVSDTPPLTSRHHRASLDWWMQKSNETDGRSAKRLRARAPTARVLVVDDNVDMLGYVSRILLDNGYETLNAPDGQAALEMLTKSTALPDLVISDVMMPRLDGKALVQALRQNDSTKNLPVILLSARAGEEERSDGLAAGADDYLVKPFSSRELLARVSARLELTRVRVASALKEQALREAAERANATKDLFLAALSHELRTPLTPALMVAEAGEQDSSLTPSVRADMALIAANLRLEIDLISDLLDLTKIRQGKLTLNRTLVDVHAVLPRVVELLRSQMQERKQTLELHLANNGASLWTLGDSTRLQQNLLGNASKFTPNGGLITLRTVILAGNKTFRVEVQDTGRGIEAHLLTRLFDAFEQGSDGTTRLFGGLGLGLSIARSLVEMHDGSIEAQSEGRGKGALFVVTLPMVTTQTPSSGTTAAPMQVDQRGAILAGRRILVVEDNLSTQLVLTRMLERLGCVCKKASTMGEALVTLRSGERFDFIVADVGLPDGSGRDVMVEARQVQPWCKGIALSGFGMPNDIQQSIDVGFSRHLVKPIRFRELQECLETIL